ncbi:folylpolyglutamate synthase [Plakobranchus ocellatus]|uniref:Folylpolyglutamate synthase n=1 Tax=Plakobranchus ocellatus TaxID=259542 RepID=A0AAV4CL18_9GAST|nr:folylpolyglutamate synthase [Plakobranchus ocellatus]
MLFRCRGLLLVSCESQSSSVICSTRFRSGSRSRLTGVYWSLYNSCKMANMASSEDSYNDAVATLHTNLVSDPGEIKVRNPAQKLPLMRSYLQRLQLSEDPKELKIIHVSGTKGKGSTCAFCESILRHHGYKTGMFTSPHMNEVRERIRINGKPISKDMFARYFWEVYGKFKQTATQDTLNKVGGIPAYYNFTVIMSLYIFLKEKVDIAIYEVGVGGEYDTTNFFLRPAVCGVTSLGYDHLTVLGDSLDQIAWHKAGIFKKGCPAVTIQQQNFPQRKQFKRLGPSHEVSLFGQVWNLLWNIVWPFPTLSSWLQSLWRFFFAKHPMQVILNRAVEKQCPLYIAAPMPLELRKKIDLGITGNHQFHNATLAIQMCKIITNKAIQKLSVRVLDESKAHDAEKFEKLFEGCGFEKAVFTPNLTSTVRSGTKMDKCGSESRRPISLTNCICKLMERIINARLMWVLEKNNNLMHEQAGFRQSRSAEDQATFIVQKIEDGFQHKKQIQSG